MEEVNQQSRKKKFIKDFGIYAIGNLGSKLITFLMIPLYTYFVENPGDYGYFDLCFQVCLLMFPIVTLQLRDGAFRFLLDTQDSTDRSRIITFVYRTLGTTIIATIAIALGVSLFVEIDYLWSTIALLVVICEGNDAGHSYSTSAIRTFSGRLSPGCCFDTHASVVIGHIEPPGTIKKP